MKVLVTGGAGYVGSHTCQALAAKGITPVTVDNLSTGKKEAVQWGPLYIADIQDTEKISQILKTEEIEYVFHFAANAYVGESMREPLMYYRNNVLGSLSLLQAMLNADLKKIIFSSTCATYGLPKNIPIDENFPQNPINPYGRSKLMVEKILQDFVSAHQFSVVALRYFNAAGASVSGRIGENHQPETHLIPLAIEAAHKDQGFKIFGDDYPTADGTCIRDFIHVDDLADAHVRALNYLKNHSGFEKINLGTENGYSVKDIIKKIEAITGKKIQTKVVPRREGDPPNLIASGKKSRQLLGWIPILSDLDKIIVTANNWYIGTQ